MLGNIFVHLNTLDDIDYEESRDRLEYYGYTIVLYNDNNLDLKCTSRGTPSFLVDKRSPNWRGWRDVLSCFTWRHREAEVQWNRDRMALDSEKVLVYNEQDDDGCSS